MQYDQNVVMLIVAAIGVVLGAFVGGGTAIVVYGRGVASVLNSPVLIRALEGAFDSFPAEAREAANTTGKVLVEATDGIPADQKHLPGAPGTEG